MIRAAHSLLAPRPASIRSFLIALICGAVSSNALAGETHERDLAAFFEKVDSTYPFFDLKGIRGDWSDTKVRLKEKVKSCETDSEFLGLVIEAIRCLRDSHLRLDPKAPLPPLPRQYYPGISFMAATSNQVVVMASAPAHASKLKPGTIITQIDNQDARDWLEQKAKEAWGPQSPWIASSPQRARLFVYRLPFAGASNEMHVLRYRSGTKEEQLKVNNDLEARGWPHQYAMPGNLKRAGRALFYAGLPSGSGYMYLRSVGAETEAGIREALAAWPSARGWIVDLRGNGGGGYDNALIQCLKEMPQPVVVLIDAGCISAGETLARDFARYSGARLLGAATAGASSSKQQWTFPSGIASVTLSTRSRWRNDGKPIEFNGIQPDEVVEAVPDEVAHGINSEIRRAEEYLARRTQDRTALSH